MELSSRFDTALALASEVHRSQYRKHGNTPYISHLLAVAALVLEHHGDEDQAIAALLHDSLEDQSDRISSDDLERAFGPRVREMVERCSDTHGQAGHPKPPWLERKEAAVRGIGSLGPDHPVLLVVAADKLHNTGCTVEALRREGPIVWKSFRATPEETCWYYRSMTAALGNTGWVHPLLDRLSRVVDELCQFAETSRSQGYTELSAF